MLNSLYLTLRTLHIVGQYLTLSKGRDFVNASRYLLNVYVHYNIRVSVELLGHDRILSDIYLTKVLIIRNLIKFF